LTILVGLIKNTNKTKAYYMRLTSRGRYAVQALADIASNKEQKPTNLTEISLRQGISISFLEQIFLQLKKRI